VRGGDTLPVQTNNGAHCLCCRTIRSLFQYGVLVARRNDAGWHVVLATSAEQCKERTVRTGTGFFVREFKVYDADKNTSDAKELRSIKSPRM